MQCQTDPTKSRRACRGVVLILADHHRWDHLGCAGMDQIQTPHLDALAARGTRVSGMYSNAPLCVPQRISLTSGRYCMNTGCFTNRQPVDPSIPTFLHQLQSHGVSTAMIGKLHHHVHAFDADFVGHEAESRQLGYDHVHETSGKIGSGAIACECRFTQFLRARGILDDYRAWMGRWGRGNGTRKEHEPWRWDPSTTQDAYIAASVCDYIEALPKDKAFYIHAGLVGPHPPTDAPPQYHEMYADVQPPPQVRDAKSWRAFAACISEVDYMVGRIMAALHAKGILDETLVLYSSDHGDNAGFHGRWGKVNFYEGSVRVPMIAAGPGITKGRVANALAELLDLGSTVCDALGAPTHHYDQGRSLMPLLTGAAEHHREDVFAEMGSDKMYFDGRYKLMYGDSTRDTRAQWANAPYNGPAFGRPVNLPPDRISIYDLQNDPDETWNLADDPACAQLRQSLIERLLNRVIRNMQSRPDGQGSVL